MPSTGDVHGCLRELDSLLRVIKYPGHVDYGGLSKGDTSSFLPIVSFTLTSFSPPVAEQLVAAGFELTSKTDLRFTDTLYKVLRDVFHYKPVLSKQQFLHWGFPQRKVSTTCDIINLVLQRHKQLRKPRVRHPVSHKVSRGQAGQARGDPDTVSNRPLVVNHMQSLFASPTNFCNGATCPSQGAEPPLDNEAAAPADEENEVEDFQQVWRTPGPADALTALQSQSSEAEERLSTLEAQMERLLSGLDRLRVLETKLEELERHNHMDEIEEPTITVPRESWENLMSRVLLLENKLELSSAQPHEPPSFQPALAPPPCISTPEASEASRRRGPAADEDLKDKIERITNMMKTTSGLMKVLHDPPQTPTDR